MSTTTTDPVCGMEVRPHQNEIIYLDIAYAFCSQQCQQRFLSSPRSYIGAAGRRQGKPVLKSRRMHLGAALSPDQADALRQQLQEVVGVTKVAVDDHQLEIVYDLAQATTEQIQLKLVEIGIQIGGGWEKRLQRAFVHYEEECTLGNLESDERHHHHP